MNDIADIQLFSFDFIKEDVVLFKDCAMITLFRKFLKTAWSIFFRENGQALTKLNQSFNEFCRILWIVLCNIFINLPNGILRSFLPYQADFLFHFSSTSRNFWDVIPESASLSIWLTISSISASVAGRPGNTQSSSERTIPGSSTRTSLTYLIDFNNPASFFAWALLSMVTVSVVIICLCIVQN
jgi:hypothetical protein